MNRVPDRLNVPVHLSLSETFVGKSNPIEYLETPVEPWFFTTRLPHHPLLHFSSYRKLTLRPAGVGVGVGAGVGVAVGVGVVVAVEVGVGVGAAVAAGFQKFPLMTSMLCRIKLEP